MSSRQLVTVVVGAAIAVAAVAAVLVNLPARKRAGTAADPMTTDGAEELAQAYIHAGGADESLVLPDAPPDLVSWGLTTRIDLAGREIDRLVLGRTGLRGAGGRQSLQSLTFVFEETLGEGSAVFSEPGKITGSNTVTYDLPYEVHFENGEKLDVWVSLHPHDGEWRVVPPAPEQRSR